MKFVLPGASTLRCWSVSALNTRTVTRAWPEGSPPERGMLPFVPAHQGPPERLRRSTARGAPAWKTTSIGPRRNLRLMARPFYRRGYDQARHRSRRRSRRLARRRRDPLQDRGSCPLRDRRLPTPASFSTPRIPTVAPTRPAIPDAREFYNSYSASSMNWPGRGVVFYRPTARPPTLT